MRIIVFGVGNNYEINKSKLMAEYEIVGFVDNNWERLNRKASIEIHPVEWIKNNKNWDYIYITPNSPALENMYIQLIDSGIDRKRIVIGAYRRRICGYSYWGQHGDDLILAAMFDQIGIEKPSYLDLGCNHPFNINNTVLFYLNGSNGVNVDASPENISLFNIYRRDDINLNLGIGTKFGKLPFYMYDERSGLNTFVKGELERINYKAKSIIQTEVVTLEYIIDNYCEGKFPDLLDCDIEGFDFEVLESYDLKTNGPKVICVEVRSDFIEKFDSLLEDKGYFRYCRAGANNIYARNEFSNTLRHIKM